MLSNLTPINFEAYLNQTFHLIMEAQQPLPFVLSEVNQIQIETPDQKAFLMKFRGPHHWILAQRTYCLFHQELGSLKMLLTPLGQYQDGIHYEAIFG